MLTKRFWLSVLVVLIVCALAMVVGALVLSGGLADYHQTGLWANIAWVIGGFAGGRFAARGNNGTVPRALLTAIVAYVVVLLIGLMVPGREMLASGWWRNAVCVIGGALAAGLISPRKKKRAGKMAGKQKRKKPR